LAALADELANLEVAGVKTSDVMGEVGRVGGLALLGMVSPAAFAVVGVKKVREAIDDQRLSTIEAISTVESYRDRLHNAALAEQSIATEAIAGASAVEELRTQLFLAVPAAERLAQVDLGRLRGQLSGLEDALVRARIAGAGRGEEQNILRQQEQNLRRQIAAAQQIGSVAQARELRRELLRVIEAQRSIEEEIAQEAEQAASEAEAARDRRHQALLDLFGLRIQRQQNAILLAESTARLSDDRKTTQELIRILREIVRDRRLTQAELVSFQQQLLQAQAQLARLREQERERRLEERREARERARESLELDIQIAEATGNRAAEVRARESEIRFLERQIRQTRAGSLQRKRLILELRQAQRELRELRDEQRKLGDERSRLAFEFLRTQQGFAANLLSNLIPLGAAGGLVGNISPTGAPNATGGAGGRALFPEGQPRIGLPGDELSSAANRAAAQAGRGQTQGQGDTQISLLRTMVRILREIERGQGFPEARRQRSAMGGSMDTL
jgi:hypothetical protein